MVHQSLATRCVREFSAQLLNVGYAIVLFAALPWILWTAWRTGKYREGFQAKLLGMAPCRQGDQPCAWLHAVSVGEVNLLGTLIAELNRQRPELQVAISTTTKTGYDLASKKYAKHLVFYCPLDFSWAVRKALRRIRPSLLILAELEIWPNLIASAKRQGVPVAVVNGRLSEHSFRGYRRVKPLIGAVLSQLDLVAAQSEESAARFLALGVRPKCLRTTGSLKFDGVLTDRQNPTTKALATLAGFTETDSVFLAGSTQAPEEEYAIRLFQQLSSTYPNFKLVIVPRHPERFAEVSDLLERSGVAWQRRSQLPSRLPTRVLLVDTVGELGAWWGTASIGFVGGSFGPREGQNMLEPAGFGTPLCFGPRTRNFRDIVERLLVVDGAKVVEDSQQLTQFVERCLADPNWSTELGKRAQQLVQSQLGATAKTVDQLLPLLPPSRPIASSKECAA